MQLGVCQVDVFIASYDEAATTGMDTAGAIMSSYVDAVGHA